MGRDTRIQLAAGIVMLCCVLGAAALTPMISSSAGRHKLVYTDRAEEGQPPEVALGIAMGAFRGLFVNYLWIRANDLKEAGKYHEAIQLSKAITKLQPRFPRVWVFHAWNMAYNISVTTQTTTERWDWVNAGINLLRSQGIPANPNDMLLHKELAWFFLHKIQGFTDDANPYYKRRFAFEWTVVLGDPPRPDANFRNREVAIKRYADWLRPIVEAPDTLDALRTSDPLVAELTDRLHAEVAENFDFEFLRWYEAQSRLQKSVRRAAIEELQIQRAPRRAALGRLLGDPKYAEAWPKLLAHVRRRLLIDKYNMEPERMLRYTESTKIGPLDWRIASAHAIYWSARGSEQNLTRWTDANKKDYDFINNDRMTIQAIQDMARFGELFFDFVGFANGQDAMFIQSPNPNFIESYANILGDLVDRSWADRGADSGQRAYSFYSAGFDNFLRDQIRYYYRRGQKDMAADLYEKLRTYPGQNMNDSARAAELAKPLDQFVADELVDQHRSTHVFAQEVTASLEGAFTSGLLAGNDEAFRSQLQYAQLYHRYYMEEQLKTNAVATQGRTENLPSDFRELVSGIFVQLLEMLELDDARQVYFRAPEDLRQAAYDLLVDRFKAEVDELAKKAGEPFDRLFPEPPGMDEFRAIEARWRAENERRRAPKASEK